MEEDDFRRLDLNSLCDDDRHALWDAIKDLRRNMVILGKQIAVDTHLDSQSRRNYNVLEVFYERLAAVSGFSSS